MPQASDELRELWGGGVGEEKAINYLESKGYILTRNCLWKLPNKNHKITQEEYTALCFLIDEWDFGGIEKEKE